MVGLDIHDLGSERLSWRRLEVFIGGFQLDPKYALFKLMNPDWRWDLNSQLIAHLADMTAGANWQRAGKKDAKKPKPIIRPGVKDSAEKSRFGVTEMSVEAAAEWLTGDGMEITASATSVV
jgi:hypothetical protein